MKRVVIRWSGEGAEATRAFERLGPGRMGVAGDASGDRPAVVATVEGSRSDFVARALPARGGRSLFRASLGAARLMAEVLER
jgi:hypothetical protein